MTPISAFRSRIAPWVAGCMDEMIDRSVLDTCIDFCDRSLVVKRQLDAFQTRSGVILYDIDGPDQQNVAQITRAWCEQTEMQPLTDDGVDAPFGVGVVVGQTMTSRPRFFTQPEPSVLALYPPPDAVYSINIRAASRPARTATRVESELFERWVEVIVAGSLQRLLLMPGAWTNPTAASIYSREYEAGVRTAMLESSRGNTRAQQRITPVHI